jgi:predicted DNA-binding ribbon-helix-helix protein
MILPLQIGARSMKSLVVKHWVLIGGHKTSVTLEAAFWIALKEIAQERHETLRHLISGLHPVPKTPSLV